MGTLVGAQGLLYFGFPILVQSLVITDKVTNWWDSEDLASGGMKLSINGSIFSFTTDVCSGGVFFKEPVTVTRKCIHGYFILRPNGCTIKGNSIVGGEDYVCLPEEADEDNLKLIQALISATNPDKPLEHTKVLFDEPNTLKNFQRFPLDNFGKRNDESSASAQPRLFTDSSDPEQFTSEILAVLPEVPEDSSQSMKYEIWGGLAYCLQANMKQLENGNTVMSGFNPSIESLGIFCPNIKNAGGRHRRSLEKRHGIIRGPVPTKPWSIRIPYRSRSFGMMDRPLSHSFESRRLPSWPSHQRNVPHSRFTGRSEHRALRPNVFMNKM